MFDFITIFTLVLGLNIHQDISGGNQPSPLSKYYELVRGVLIANHEYAKHIENHAYH